MNPIRAWEERIVQIARDCPADGLAQLAGYFDEAEAEWGIEHLAVWSAAAMFGYGQAGVQCAVTKYRNARNIRGHVAVLSALYAGGTSGSRAADETESAHNLWKVSVPTFLVRTLDADTKRSALAAFRELVLSMTPSEDLYLSQLIMNDSVHAVAHGAPGVVKAVAAALRDATIAISPEILMEFRNLINQELREEEYQRFLAQRAVLLDPLAATVMPKHRLGSEFVADYVVASLAGRHTIVEIERPQDAAFTGAGDYSARLTHALRQVLDSQDWVEHNAAYAREILPGITSPYGLVVIGRSSQWSEAEHRRLRRLNIALEGRVRVATYDDIMNDGERLYANILEGQSDSDVAGKGGGRL